MLFIPDTIVRAVCWTLLHSLWQGLIFAVVAGVVLVLTKKSGASLRYNLLCGGLCLFLAVSGYTFYRQLVPAGAGMRGVASTAAMVNGRAGEAAEGGADLAATIGAGHTLRSGIDALVGYFNRNASLVVLIWFMVFVARFVQLLSGWVYTQRIRHYQTRPAPADWQERLARLLEKLRITRPVSLLESALVKVPVVVGALKPIILVPMGMLAGLPPEQVESILLHELAHIRRRDYLFNLVQHVVDTVFFFNPALIWVSSLIRAERENCCDDVAIRETKSRRRLIEALVSFHEYEQSAQGYALGFAAQESQVVRRVKRIVDKTNHSLNAGERVLLMGGLMVMCAAFATIKAGRGQAAAPVVTMRQTTVVKPAAKIVDTTIKPVIKEAQAPTRVRIAAAKDTVSPVEDDPFSHLTVDQIIECRDHGVTPGFIADFKKMGYKHISIDRAIELKDHGVSTDFIAGFIAAGYDRVSLDQALELRDHGVSVEFIRDLHGLGFANISLEKATELVDHGVTIDFITSWQKKTGKLLELDDYIKLRDAGISPRS
jgi:bla regulator protein BlaR1